LSSYEEAEEKVSKYLGGTKKKAGVSLYDLEIQYNSVYSPLTGWTDYTTYINLSKRLYQKFESRPLWHGGSFKLRSCSEVMRQIEYALRRLGRDDEQRILLERISRICSISRISLLMVGGVDWREILKYALTPDVLRVHLTLYTRDVSSIRANHLISLLISLYLGCVGTGANRGLGSIVVRNVSPKANLPNEVLNSLIEVNNVLRTSLDQESNERFTDIQDKILDAVAKSPSYKNVGRGRGIPPSIPTFRRGAIRVSLYTPHYRGDVIGLVSKLGNVFNRNSLIGRKRGDVLLERVLLGLPRSQEKKKRKGNVIRSGFFAMEKREKTTAIHQGRRRSYISSKIVAYVDEKGYVDRPRVILVGFLSSDIYPKIKWIGRGRDAVIEFNNFAKICSYFSRIYCKIAGRLVKVLD